MVEIYFKLVFFLSVGRHAAQNSVCDILIVPPACMELWMECSKRQGWRAVLPSVMLSMLLSLLTLFLDLVIPVWMVLLLASLARSLGNAVE